MGFQCTPQIIGLTRESSPKGKHRANGLGICLEQGEERASLSETLNRDKSDLNIYDGFSSGRECWEDMEERAKNHKCKVIDKNGIERERSVRSDAVIGYAMIFNPPPEMCIGWTDDDFNKFSNDSFECLEEFNKIYRDEVKKRDTKHKEIPLIFRKENIKMKSRHKDEGEHESDYHDHYICDAIDERGEYNGNMIDAQFLSSLNKRFPEMMREKGWELDDLDVTDWDRFKTDEAYRKERQHKIREGSRSVNEHMKAKAQKQLKEQKEKIATLDSMIQAQDDLSETVQARDKAFSELCNMNNAIIDNEEALEALEIKKKSKQDEIDKELEEYRKQEKEKADQIAQQIIAKAEAEKARLIEKATVSYQYLERVADENDKYQIKVLEFLKVAKPALKGTKEYLQELQKEAENEHVKALDYAVEKLEALPVPEKIEPEQLQEIVEQKAEHYDKVIKEDVKMFADKPKTKPVINKGYKPMTEQEIAKKRFEKANATVGEFESAKPDEKPLGMTM